MNVFLTVNKKINNVCRANIFFCPSGRGAKERITPQKVNTTPIVVITCTILRKYLAIIDPLTANLGLHITRSANNPPFLVINSPNSRSFTGYGHTNSKTITSLTIFGGAFMYLLPCTIVLSNKNIYIPTVHTHVIIKVGTQ